jgi:hypothetical protein
MASHFVSLNRGQTDSGIRQSDFVTGAASSANVGIEVRLDDASGFTRKDVLNALRAIEMFFESRLDVAAGFIVGL